MTLNALIIYICSVNFICADVTAMLFRSAIILTVWQATSCSEFNTFNVKLSVITVCFPVIFKLSGPRNVLKIVCAIDRLRIWKHCLTTMCLSSSCLVSISEWPSPTQSCFFVRCSALSPKLIFKPLFNSDQFQLNARCLFIVRANVSNLSKICVIFVADRCSIGSIYYFNKNRNMLRVPLPTRDAYTIILRPLYMFTDLIDICHKQMLMYDYITF